MASCEPGGFFRLYGQPDPASSVEQRGLRAVREVAARDDEGRSRSPRTDRAARAGIARTRSGDP